MARFSIKQFMPRSFYGRAALILIVPIVIIQIVLSVVFIQRHFERVTAQMTENIVLDIGLIIDRLDKVPDSAADAASALNDMSELVTALQIGVRLLAPPEIPALIDRRGFLDLAGREVIRVFRANLPGYLATDLEHPDQRVHVYLQTRQGVLDFTVPRNRLTASNPHQLLVIVFLASLLMTAISIIFLRNQVRPIRRLAEAAEAYGRGETVRYRPSGAREIRAAGRAFVDMRARIERQNAQRLVMLSGVSHDMRTPLTRMRLTLSLMPESRDTESLATEIDELQALLDSFLDFTRGQVGSTPEDIDPHALLEAILTRHGGDGAPIARKIAPDLPSPIRLHPQLFERALDNLIVNAQRHGNKVALDARVIDGWLEVAIEDDGPGIAPADRIRAREPFVRLDEARERNRKPGRASGAGVGLGLAIAEDAMRAHGGVLLLEDSTALGGLRAVLRLPVQSA